MQTHATHFLMELECKPNVPNAHIAMVDIVKALESHFNVAPMSTIGMPAIEFTLECDFHFKIPL